MPATITALPTPPSRTDPSTFSTKADAFLGALPTFGTECNALAAEVTTNANTASTAASDTLTMKNDVTAMKNLTEGYKNTAESSATAAVNAYDSFDDRYLGSKASDPTLDNDGNNVLMKLAKLHQYELVFKYLSKDEDIINHQNKLRVKEDIFNSIQTEEDETPYFMVKLEQELSLDSNEIFEWVERFEKLAMEFSGDYIGWECDNLMDDRSSLN